MIKYCKAQFTLLIIIISLVLVACASDQRQALRTPGKDIEVVQTITVDRLWRSDIGQGSGRFYLRLNPVIGGNIIYGVDYRGIVTATDRLSGRRIWRENVQQPITSNLALSDDLLLLGTGEGDIIALDRQDGTIVWTTTVLSEILSEPVVTGNGRVLVKTADDRLIVLALHDGEKLWSYSASSPLLTLRGSSTPFYIADADVILTGFSSGRLALFHGSNGEKIWEIPIVVGSGATDLERMVDINVDPIVINDIAYIASYQGHILALDLTNGDLLWRHELSAHAGMSIDGNDLFTTDSDGYVWAFDRIDGSVLWHQTQLAYHLLTAPVLQGDYLIVGDEEGYLYWLSKRDGHIAAKISTSSRGILANPLVVDNTLYVFTRGGKLIAYTLSI